MFSLLTCRLQIPIGIIATGSGNGLARSLSAYYDDSEEYKSNPVLYSTLSVARGCIIPVNLVKKTKWMLSHKKFYSRCSILYSILMYPKHELGMF